jgi:hypothetical protein
MSHTIRGLYPVPLFLETRVLGTEEPRAVLPSSGDTNVRLFRARRGGDEAEKDDTGCVRLNTSR